MFRRAGGGRIDLAFFPLDDRRMFVSTIGGDLLANERYKREKKKSLDNRVSIVSSFEISSGILSVFKASTRVRIALEPAPSVDTLRQHP